MDDLNLARAVLFLHQEDGEPIAHRVTGSFVSAITPDGKKYIEEVELARTIASLLDVMGEKPLHILRDAGVLRNVSQMSFVQLTDVRGIGKSTASKIVAITGRDA